jgi:hypothetical protein
MELYKGVFVPFRVRVEGGFSLGILGTKLLQDEIVFFDGSTMLVRGFRFQNKEFNGAIKQRWAQVDTQLRPLTQFEMDQSTGRLRPPYDAVNAIVRVLVNDKSRYQAFCAPSLTKPLLMLTPDGVMDIMTKRATWDDPPWR